MIYRCLKADVACSTEYRQNVIGIACEVVRTGAGYDSISIKDRMMNSAGPSQSDLPVSKQAGRIFLTAI